jgi:hypothetical protein
MNLAGFVPLRRSVFEHTANGRLSSNECLVFLLLVALADRRTGSGTINAPSLRAFLPELSYDAAKRVLCSLESKGYVFRDIVPFSKRVYRFWINKYRPTDGQYKSLQINISKALESRDVNDIAYINPAPEGALEGALETALEGAPNYEKREERIEKREDSSIEKQEKPALKRTVTHVMSAVESAKRSAICCPARSAHEAPHDALPDATHEALPAELQNELHHELHVSRTEIPKQKSPQEVGLRWDGGEGAFVDVATGWVLSYDQSQRRLRGL